MTQGKTLLAALLVSGLLAGASALRAADDMEASPATQPSAAGEMPSAHHRGRLVQPYSLLKDLSDDQKTQLEQIHADATAKIDAIRDKEKADSEALLSDAQKAELQKIEDEQVASRKEKAASRRKKTESAATQPTE